MENVSKNQVKKVIVVLLFVLALTGAVVGYFFGIEGLYDYYGGGTDYEWFYFYNEEACEEDSLSYITEVFSWDDYYNFYVLGDQRLCSHYDWEQYAYSVYMERVFGTVVSWKHMFLIAIGCSLVTIFTFVYLVRAAAGTRKGVLLRAPYIIPLSMQLAVIAGGAALAVQETMQLLCYRAMAVDFIGATAGIIIVAAGWIWMVMHVCTRFQSAEFWHSFISYRLVMYLKREVCALKKQLQMILVSFPLYWQMLLGYAIFSFLEMWVVIFIIKRMTEFGGIIIFIWVVKTIMISVALVVILVNLRVLQKAGENLAAGNLRDKVEVAHLLGPFRQFGDTLNSINVGIANAVQEQMKSERMKTELITNVSHDIKTPLTSIINYVDLMIQHGTEDETLLEYEEVLSRQSLRMKKLIEDLIEASKAAAGNLNVMMAETDVGILLNQAMAEFEERLAGTEISVVEKKPDQPVWIMADGKYLWRVFENLLTNVVKYGMPHTRLYIDLEMQEDMVRIIFRNISKFQLNINGEELMERFTRGDSSRHTEGNGLGLSIAKSLVEIQNGAMDILVDADLFKVIIQFPRLEKQKEKERLGEKDTELLELKEAEE